MKRFIILTLVALLSLGAWAKREKRVVVFDVDIHCQGCVTKIEKNIAFEKGVQDLVCDLEHKTVTVTYDPNKTDIPTLISAFGKINKTAAVHVITDSDNAPVPDEEPEAEETGRTDAVTGATQLQ